MSIFSQWLGQKTGGLIGDKYYPGSPNVGPVGPTGPAARPFPGTSAMPQIPGPGINVASAVPFGIGQGGFTPGQWDVGDIPIVGGLMVAASDWVQGKRLGNDATDQAANLARKTGYSGYTDSQLMGMAAQGDQKAAVALMGRYPEGMPVNQAGMGTALLPFAKGLAKGAAGIAVGMGVEKGLDWMFGASKKKHRHMNVLNPRALSRANRRVTGFAAKARPILKDLGYSFSTHRHVKPKKKRR